MVIKVTDILTNLLATHLESKNQYFCVGTGDVATSGDQSDLNYPIAIDSGDPTNRNKVIESGTINANMVVLTYRLASTEPSGIPVTLNEIGTFNAQTDSDDLNSRYVLPTGQTKDNLSEWVIRATATIIESGT